MRRALLRTPAFVRSAKRFVKKRPGVIDALRHALVRLEADAFEPGLRTHKLQGDVAGCWASSAGYDLRIVFQLVEHGGAEAILLLSIGTHDEVY